LSRIKASKSLHDGRVFGGLEKISAEQYNCQREAEPQYDYEPNNGTVPGYYVYVWGENGMLDYTLDFGNETTVSFVRLSLSTDRGPYEDTEIHIYLDNLESDPIATTYLNNTGDYNNWKSFDAFILDNDHQQIAGIHDVYITFFNQIADATFFQWFQFNE